MNFSGRLNKRNIIKLLGDKTSSLSLAHGRLVLIKAFFVLAFLLVAVRAGDLAILQSIPRDKIAEQMAQENPEARKKASAIPRGKIFDREGVLIATTLKTASLYADPYLISDPQNAAKKLTEIFPDLSYGKVLKDLQGKKRFAWIKRNIMPDEQMKILALGEPGLEFEYEYRRFYPQSTLAAHLVGYTDIDNKGIAGIEKSFDETLAAGKDIHLSIDIRLQHILRREIMKAAKDFNAIAGSGAIMDVNTGEVLAGISWPDFDPNGEVMKISPNNLFNRLTLGTYELGSVFKIFSTAAFLENYDVPMSTTFDASKPIKSGRFRINDYHAENRILTIPEVFMHSSNIGSAMMGQAVGTEKLRSFYEDVGLLRPLELDVPEIGKPMVPNPWREINTLTASYGHGLATTPMHLITAFSSIVNGGFIVKPQIVIGDDTIVKKNTKVSVVSPQTADKMRQLLRLVVTEGTGSKAEVPGYYVGGKTGTAEKIGGRGYDTSRLISSFAGAFPIENPKYAIFIAIDEPKGTKESYGYATAGWVAAPAVARVISGMASVLGLMPENIAQEKDLSEGLKQYISLKKKHG